MTSERVSKSGARIQNILKSRFWEKVKRSLAWIAKKFASLAF